VHRKDDCIFCKIVSGDAPSFKVAEDDLTYSFMDIFPVAPGHTLIITKEHFTDIFEATPEAIAAVAATSVRVAGAIDSTLGPDGLGVFQLNREAAGQTVFHYHVHLIPRSRGDALQLHTRVPGDETSLAGTAASLASTLEAE